MLIAALLPVTLIPEALAGAMLVLAGRYDVRGWFLAVTQGFRLAGIAAGAHYGVDQAVLGLVARPGRRLVRRRRGRAGLLPPVAGGANRSRSARTGAEIVRFVVQSSVATGMVSLRGSIVPLLVGVVTTPTQVGYFRAAQAPQTGSVGAQLADPPDHAHRADTRLGGGLARRRSSPASAGSRSPPRALMAVSVPPVYVFMPDLVRIFYGSSYAPAANAARLMLIAAAVQLVVAWTKSFPVSIGRPGLRILTHGVETRVLIPLALVLGHASGTRPVRPRPSSSRPACSPPSGSRALTRIRRSPLLFARDRVRVLIVSGIWPPDVGGPASHAPEVAAFLQRRGHEVEVLTTALDPPAPRPYPVRWVPRRSPPLASLRARRRAVGPRRPPGRRRLLDGHDRPDPGGALAGRAPRVVKLTGDPAYERALRYGLTSLPLDAFQRARGGRIGVLRAVRERVPRRRGPYVCPSRALREIASRWRLVDPARIRVLPNPVAPPPPADREELRGRHRIRRADAGRRRPARPAEGARTSRSRPWPAATGSSSSSPATGPSARGSRASPAACRSASSAPRPREEVQELLAAADAVVLSSSWENFPHAAVEALAAGTPVIATGVGGVAEIVEDGVNGLLVPPGDSAALAGAIRRFLGDEALRARLRAAAAASVARLRARAGLRPARGDAPRGGRVTPRVLFVGPDPLRAARCRRASTGSSRSLERELDYRVVARGSGERIPGSGCFPRAQSFYVRLPAALRREIVSFRPARGRRRGPAHGGDRARRPRGRPRRPPAGDRRGARQLAARDPAVRLAGAPRCSHRSSTRSTPTASAARTPPARCPGTRPGSSARRGARRRTRCSRRTATCGLRRRTRRSRCPSGRRRSSSACSSGTRTSTASRPRGAWPRRGCPRRACVVVGKGSRAQAVEGLVAELAGRVRHVPEVAPEGVAAALDEATVPGAPLALRGSRAGGDRGVRPRPRRGRERGGGITDLVEDGREGCSSADDVEGLAAALVRVLSDRAARRAPRRGRARALSRVEPEPGRVGRPHAGARRHRSRLSVVRARGSSSA